MTDNPRAAIKTMRKRLNASDSEAEENTDLYEISEADRNLLIELSDTIRLLGPSEYSQHRHEFLLRRGCVIAKHVGGLADALEDRTAAEEIVSWINTEKTDSPETNKDYRVALRTIGRILTNGDDPPTSLEWIPGGYPKNYDKAPQPEEMFRWEEHVLPMLDACNNSRDRALIAFAWDVGPRPSELFDLTIDRFSDHEYGMKVTLYRGKQGTRSPILIPSVTYVKKWFDDHPADQESGAPIWSKRSKVDSITNNRIRDIFKEVAGRADMTPPSTPTPSRFRKSSASYLASQNVSQAHLEDHHGWSRGSEVASRYVAVFDKANEREIAKAHGIDVSEDEPDPTGPIICPRCEQQTPRNESSCVWCGQALSIEAAESAEAQEKRARETLASLDPEEASEVQETIELLSDPTVRSQLQSLANQD